MAIKRITAYTLETVPESIKSLRKEHGFSQKELARLSGLTESAVSRYENGNRKVSIDAYQKIVEACGHQIQII